MTACWAASSLLPSTSWVRAAAARYCRQAAWFGQYVSRPLGWSRPAAPPLCCAAILLLCNPALRLWRALLHSNIALGTLPPQAPPLRCCLGGSATTSTASACCLLRWCWVRGCALLPWVQACPAASHRGAACLIDRCAARLPSPACAFATFFPVPHLRPQLWPPPPAPRRPPPPPPPVSRRGPLHAHYFRHKLLAALHAAPADRHRPGRCAGGGGSRCCGGGGCCLRRVAVEGGCLSMCSRSKPWPFRLYPTMPRLYPTMPRRTPQCLAYTPQCLAVPHNASPYPTMPRRKPCLPHIPPCFLQAGALPVVFSLLGDLYDPSLRAGVSSIVQLSTGVGLAVGQGIAGFAGEAGWGPLGWGGKRARPQDPLAHEPLPLRLRPADVWLAPRLSALLSGMNCRWLLSVCLSVQAPRLAGAGPSSLCRCLR